MSINRDYAAFLASFNSTKFNQLWPAQEHVLHNYASDFAPSSKDTSFTPPSDIAVELPTGAGKTLIALLIAEAWRQERKTVAILSANKTLARQMMAEAELLNVPAVLMEGKSSEIPALSKRSYQRATKIAIMNYWVYFNQNPVIDPADIIIMDDAHLAELCLHSLYSVEIDKVSYKDLFRSLVGELEERFPDYTVLSDAQLKGVRHKARTELLSFIDQVEVADRIREIIDASPYIKSNSDLSFRWGRIRNKLNQANIYISTNSIWIRPYIYPLQSNEYYKKTIQRIYLSATIGDPSDLSRRLGVGPIQKIPISPEYVEKTSGRRLVIMGKMEGDEYLERVHAILFAALQIHPKSVWLCASNAEANKYKEIISEWLQEKGFTHNTWLLTSQGDEIEQFKKSVQGHLFVAGRFDGMDFNADECRLVIIPNLPRAINAQEEFISANLHDASFMKKRLNQRIVQALGRCNRSDEDFGLYLLADQQFANYFSNESSREGIPRNIVAEIDMAQDLAEREEKDVIKSVKKFLREDFKEYDIELDIALSNVPDNTITYSPPDTSDDEVMGWNALFESQNYKVAIDRFRRCWDITRSANLIEIGAFHGWHWAKSLYLQSLLGEPAAREKSLKVLEEAIRRGGQSVWFNRMSASLNRATQSSKQVEGAVQQYYADVLIREFDDVLESLGTKTNKFEDWCKKITEQLESVKHNQYQMGLKQLGKLIGYDTLIPEYQGATDCLWRGVFGNHREVITFEAKIEHVSSHQITFSEVGQANNQHVRIESEYRGYIVREVFVTHLTSVASEANASLGNIKVIEKDAVLKLWEKVKLNLSRYRDGWSLYDIPARVSASQIVRAKLPKTGWLIRVLDTEEIFINAARLCAEWT